MTGKLKLILSIVMAAIGAIIGIKMAHSRQLKQARRRAVEAHEEAIRHGDREAAAVAAAAVARVERDLAVQRAVPVADRVAAAVAEARRRRAGNAAG